MDKTIISVFIIVVVLIGGWFFFNNSGGSFASDETIEGVITEVDLTQTAFDGPAIVKVSDNSGKVWTVEVRTDGLAVCPAFQDIADAFWLNIGESVQIRGEIGSNGNIIPCASENHYFRVESEI